MVGTRQRLSLWIFIIAALTMGAVYAFFDPAETVWMPKCPVHLLTGFDCPGCGSQRALHALLHGDFAGAFRANALLFLIIPVVMVMAVAEFNRKRWPRLHKALLQPAFVYGILSAVVCWTIFRNIIG